MPLIEIIKFILSKTPRKYFVKCFAKCYEGFRHNPIPTLLLLGLIYWLWPLIFYHKNANFIKEHQDHQIEIEINKALNYCGNGTTIGRVSIGTIFASDEANSFLFNIMRSCDKSLIKERKDKSCDLDVKWLNPEWRKIHQIDSRTLDVLNQDTLDLGHNSIVFKDGQPIWLTMFKEDGSLTKDGNMIKVITPKLFEILASSKRSVRSVGVVKVRHPIYKNIVYLYTLSFWYNNSGLPEMNCKDGKSKILSSLARLQRKQLEY